MKTNDYTTNAYNAKLDNKAIMSTMVIEITTITMAIALKTIKISTVTTTITIKIFNTLMLKMSVKTFNNDDNNDNDFNKTVAAVGPTSSPK